MKHRRAIGRIAIRALIFLLLGAIVNIAVAWGSVLWGPRRTIVDPYSSTADERWRRYMPSTCVATARIGEIHEAGWGELVILEGMCACNPRPDRIWDQSEGWPCLSMNGQLWTHSHRRLAQLPPPSKMDPRVGMFIGRGTWLERYARRDRPLYLPLRPLWPGFALNTLFYAAIVWLLSTAPLALFRRLRIKRGLCPACAYPIGTSPVCTECGKPVNPRKPRSVEPASS